MQKFKLVQNDRDTHLNISTVALTGNRELVVKLLEPLIKHENYGFNKLHLDVVKLNKLEEKYATISITKKGSSANNVTPFHLACINPNSEILETLMKQCTDVNVMDTLLRKPIHYAAACETSDNLELLLAKGANVFDVD